MTNAELSAFYRSYGESSFRPDEPVYADICRGLGDFPAVLELISRHLPQARQPNLLFAAVHYLLLGGLDHDLGQAYAGNDAGDPAELFADLVLTNGTAIEELLATRSTQTNEVGRSAVLALLLRDACQTSGQDVGWIDLGASAGLNLNLDRYGIRYERDGGVEMAGTADAAVQLTCAISGGPPINPNHVPIAWRIGVDRAPIDVADADELRWLHACLWPSQAERHHRLRGASAVAQQSPPPMIEADAAEGLARAIERAPTTVALVVTTTWVWYYLPPSTKQAVLDVMTASPRRILWYSIEGRGVVELLNQPLETESIESSVGRIAIGGGQRLEATVLGHCHAHGASLTWY